MLGHSLNKAAATLTETSTVRKGRKLPGCLKPARGWSGRSGGNANSANPAGSASKAPISRGRDQRGQDAPLPEPTRIRGQVPAGDQSHRVHDDGCPQDPVSGQVQDEILDQRSLISDRLEVLPNQSRRPSPDGYIGGSPYLWNCPGLFSCRHPHPEFNRSQDTPYSGVYNYLFYHSSIRRFPGVRAMPQTGRALPARYPAPPTDMALLNQ